MSLTPTVLAASNNAGNLTAYSTAAFAPGANELVLLCVWGSSSSTPAQPTVSGGGMTTWTWVTGGAIISTGINRTRLDIFRAQQASPGASAPATINYGTGMSACAWAVVKFAGTVTTGSNGADAVPTSQQSFSATNGKTVSLSLPGGLGVDDALFGALGHNFQEQATSGLTELSSNNSGDGTAPGNLETVWGSSSSVQWDWATSVPYGAIAVRIVAYVTPLPPGVPSDLPTGVLELNLNDPTSATKNWIDISNRILNWRYRRARQYELEKVETGTYEVELRNHDGALTPDYTGGPYYGSLYAGRELRYREIWKGSWEYIFYGFIDDYDLKREAFGSQSVVFKANDGFEVLGVETISPAVSTLTTALGVANGDLTYTSQGSASTISSGIGGFPGPIKGVFGPVGGGVVPPGSGSGSGEAITIEYVIQPDGNAPVYVEVTGVAIKVNLHNDGSGGAHTPARNIMAAVNGHAEASRLVKVTLAPANNGNGEPGTMSPTPLVGSFPSELSGARINRTLNSLQHSWPDRAIDTGAATIESSSFAKTDNVSALTHVQAVEDTEIGIVFMDGRNRVTFHDRNHRTGASVAATVTDKTTAGQYSYVSCDPKWDRSKIYNEIVGTTNSGLGPTTVSDTTSKTRFRVRTRTVQVMLTTLGALSTYLNAILAKFKDQKLRYDTITFEFGTGDPLFDVMYDWDISTLLTVKRQILLGPGSSTEVSSNHFVEGRELSRDENNKYTLVLYTSPQ